MVAQVKYIILDELTQIALCDIMVIPFLLLHVVDTTTMNPWTGSFLVPKTGLWRFTFGALTNEGTNYAVMVELKVNGNPVANTFLIPNTHGTHRPLSITSIQKLEAGQTVTIEYNSEGSWGINYTGEGITNWTGMYSGSGLMYPPNCEKAGQTFPYPGSCRKYYSCKAKGNAEVLDCCPDVYVNNAGSCLSENFVNVNSLCNRDDSC